MNFIKLFIISLMILSPAFAHVTPATFVEKTLHEKGKSIQEAEDMLELLQATGEYIKTAEMLENIYLNN